MMIRVKIVMPGGDVRMNDVAALPTPQCLLSFEDVEGAFEIERIIVNVGNRRHDATIYMKGSRHV